MERDRLIVDICAQYQVSPRQAEVVIAEEDHVVVACPGSGKTRTVGTRLAYKLKNWRDLRKGIAVISFTNVAAKEISDRLESLGLPRTLPFPHFLGTINSFFDRLLFMPHAHRVMRPGLPPKRPQLVLSHNEDWVNDTFTSGTLKRRGIKICNFHYQLDGTVLYQDPENRITPSYDEMQVAKRDKRKMALGGYATHADAMYWTMVLVRAFPEIAQAVSGRFAEVIIDEFQDTSNIQLEILKSLFANNIGNLIFVGDPDQSIFGFNAACPEVLLEPGKAFDRRWSRIELTDNYRSSQVICDSTCRFRARRESDHALGEFSDFGVEPMLFSYLDRHVEQVINVFSEILERFEVPLQEGVILTRRNAVVKKLRGGHQNARKFPSSVRLVVRKLARAAYLRDLQDWANAENEIEYVSLRLICGEIDHSPFRQDLGTLTYREWKQGIGFLLDNLPRTDRPLGEWLVAGRTAFSEFREKFPWECKEALEIGRLFPNIRSGERERLVSEFLESAEIDSPFDIKTIHQAKGESHTATMVVGTPHRSNSPSDVYSWFRPTIENGLCTEDVRCAFVAFTRPRKILVVAVPQSVWEDVKPHFLESGFVEV